MSYEGHYQHICKKGHYYEVDAYEAVVKGADTSCPECGEEAVWSNGVDDTNCDSYGIIPRNEMAKFISVPAEETKCEHCNSVLSVKPAQYRIPTEEETKAAQHFYKTLDNGGLVLCPVSEDLED